MTFDDEISATVARVLDIDAALVAQHLEGLRLAGREERDTFSLAADLLCCCLSTEVRNATAPFHLPLVGVIKDGRIAAADASIPARLNTFGQVITGLIDGSLSGQIDVVERLEVIGRGPGLRAAVFAEHADGSDLQLWFGYEMLPGIRLRPKASPTALQPRVRVSGHVIGLLQDVTEGPEAKQRRSTAQRFLNRARLANTPQM